MPPFDAEAFHAAIRIREDEQNARGVLDKDARERKELVRKALEAFFEGITQASFPASESVPTGQATGLERAADSFLALANVLKEQGVEGSLDCQFDDPAACYALHLFQLALKNDRSTLLVEFCKLAEAHRSKQAHVWMHVSDIGRLRILDYLPNEMQMGGGEKLLDLLEMSGTGRNKLQRGRELIEKNRFATGQQVVEALKSASIPEGTLEKARSFYGGLFKPLTLNVLAYRLANPTVYSDYRRKFIESVPQWSFIRDACRELFAVADVNEGHIEQLVSKLRIKLNLENAGDLPLADVEPHIRRLLAPVSHKEHDSGIKPKGTPAEPQEQRKLKRAESLAYLAYHYAESMAERTFTDQQAHEWLTEQGIDPSKGDCGELTDYDLPDFPTWTRYLSAARTAYGENKNQKRAGRKLGKSIARRKDIESRKKDA